MGEIAEMMITGILCAGCGAALDCDTCAEIGVPAYDSYECAKDHGGVPEQVCSHQPAY